VHKPLVNMTATRGEIMERLLIVKDSRTHRKRVPTETTAAVQVGENKYEIPTSVTSEGGILITLSAEQTNWFHPGDYAWDVWGTVSRSALLTSTPLTTEMLAYGTLTVQEHSSITPVSVGTQPLTLVYTPGGGTGASLQAGASGGVIIGGGGTINEDDLEPYVTETELTATLVDYVTNDALTTALDNYSPSPSAGSYVIDSQLDDYVTDTELTTQLGDYVTAASAGSTFVSNDSLSTTLTDYTPLTSLKKASGYEFTAGFADRTTGTASISAIGSDVEYTAQMVTDKRWYRFGFSSAQQLANDNPYWSDPVPDPAAGIGLFGGQHMPLNTTNLFDFGYSDTDYSAATSFNGGALQVTAANGSFDFRQVAAGSLILTRFDFNATPTVSNTNIEVAMIWSTRDGDDNITFTFPLTHQPIVFGSGTAGVTTLCRPMLSAYMASSEDVNSRALLAVRSDQPIFIQPLTTLVTVIT
jgi:hypothetical protein